MNERKEEIIAPNTKKNKKNFMIGEISLWRILAYFVFYSVAGYVIETIFGVVRTGYLESRQSFLYGPFCAVYGLGACTLIIFLQFFKKNGYTLFLGGILIGSVTEYIVSLIGEWLFNTKWWDYSAFPLNINGRICLLYSLFWGILALVLLKYVNPKLDKIFEWTKKKFNIKLLKTILLTTIIVMAIDYIISCFAIAAFLSRTIVKNNIEVNDKVKVENEYRLLYSTKEFSNFIYKHFGDEKMLMTYPRLKIETTDGEIIHVRDLYKDVKSYYFKFKNVN